MYPNYSRDRRRLRVLRDEIRNEEFYYRGKEQVFPEDFMPEEEEEEDASAERRLA